MHYKVKRELGGLDMESLVYGLVRAIVLKAYDKEVNIEELFL
jgi:hypothetical protein